ncbi:MAG: hypothetical protein AAF547_14520 [Actinomycetota bacterium]
MRGGLVWLLVGAIALAAVLGGGLRYIRGAAAAGAAEATGPSTVEVEVAPMTADGEPADGDPAEPAAVADEEPAAAIEQPATMAAGQPDETLDWCLGLEAELVWREESGTFDESTFEELLDPATVEESTIVFTPPPFDGTVADPAERPRFADFGERPDPATVPDPDLVEGVIACEEAGILVDGEEFEDDEELEDPEFEESEDPEFEDAASDPDEDVDEP